MLLLENIIQIGYLSEVMRIADFGQITFSGLGQAAVASRVGTARFRVYDPYNNPRPAGVPYLIKLPDKDVVVRTDDKGYFTVEYLHPTASTPFDQGIAILPLFPYGGMWFGDKGIPHEEDQILGIAANVKFVPSGASGVINLKHLSERQGIPKDVTVLEQKADSLSSLGIVELDPSDPGQAGITKKRLVQGLPTSTDGGYRLVEVTGFMPDGRSAPMSNVTVVSVGTDGKAYDHDVTNIYGRAAVVVPTGVFYDPDVTIKLALPAGYTSIPLSKKVSGATERNASQSNYYRLKGDPRKTYTAQDQFTVAPVGAKLPGMAPLPAPPTPPAPDATKPTLPSTGPLAPTSPSDFKPSGSSGTEKTSLLPYILGSAVILGALYYFRTKN